MDLGRSCTGRRKQCSFPPCTAVLYTEKLRIWKMYCNCYAAMLRKPKWTRWSICSHHTYAHSDWLKSIKFSPKTHAATPGMHYPHSRFQIRRVRMAEESELLAPLLTAGYHIEDDVCKLRPSGVQNTLRPLCIVLSADDIDVQSNWFFSFQ